MYGDDDDDDMAYDQGDEEINSDQWQVGFLSLVYIFFIILGSVLGSYQCIF